MKLFLIFFYCFILLFGLIFSKCLQKPFGLDTKLDQKLQDYYIEQFKELFLKELKLKKAPNVSESAKKALIGQLKSIGQIVDDDKLEEKACLEDDDTGRRKRQVEVAQQVQQQHSQVIERIISAGEISRSENVPAEAARTYFNLGDLQAPAFAIARATLHLFLTVADPFQNIELRIYKYINDDEIAVTPVFHHSVRVDSNQRVYADVTRLVKKWVQSPDTNYGLLIKAEANGQSVLNRTDDDSHLNENILLHIEFTNSGFDPPWDLVPRRAEQLCSDDQPNRNCCRYRLEISLDQVGLGFVISPRRINIYHCKGECPFGHLLTSRHAHMMQQAASISEDEERAHNIGPCCVPTEFQNLTVLYMPNEYSVQETTIVNIIALRCGCS